MRLLITSDAVGGVWTYSSELTTGMLERGNSVLLVVVGPAPAPDQAEWLRRVGDHWAERFSYRHIAVALEWMDDGAGCYARSEAAMLALCAEFQPDVVHCNQFCYGALPLSLHARAIPKVVAAHSDVLSWWRARYGSPMPPSGWRAAYVTQVEAGLAGADVVVAPSEASLADLKESFAFRTPARSLLNGRTTASAGLSDAELFRGKALQAMTCGRAWDEGKNVALLKQMRSVPLPIAVAGQNTGDETPTPEKAACGDANSAGTRRAGVRYTGRLPSQATERLMRESSMYVVTSRYEPFGLAAVEAALAGCAIVASDLASQREVWGDAAVFFPSDDANALEQVLRELAVDPERVLALGRRCRIRAKRYLRADTMVEGYAALYDGLVPAQQHGVSGEATRGARVA